ncbi:MAG: DUF58 domain-containing protein [Deltaproteobacteria bacterium]|jgi:uncharacterized protein (DUF58 family)|nr:DUF58 domain-containing protein [Deltaproteobacteria bacterium]
MIKPTVKLALIFALSAPLAALTLAVFESHWLTALYYPFMCLMVMFADVSMIAPAGNLDVETAAPSRISLGVDDFLTVTIKHTAAKRNTVFEAKLELGEGPLASMETPIVSAALINGTATLRLPLKPRRRGRLLLGNLWLRWRGPLGLCQSHKIKPLSGAIDVIQNIQGLHEQALMFFHYDAVLGLKNQPFRGEGVEFDSLVDFAPGMDNRTIDWKHSARHRKLLAKEFRQEKNNQIVLGFDTGRLMTEPINGLSKLDHFIRAGLVLAWVSLLSGDMVGASGFDLTFNSFLKPTRGHSFFAKLQHFTANLTYQTCETNFTVGLAELQSRLPHRSLIVIFTEFIDTVTADFLVEALGLLARKHMVFFVTMPDPLLTKLKNQNPIGFEHISKSVIADGFARERSIVLEKAVRLGVHTIDVPPSALTSAILNRYLTIKQRGLL